MLVDRLEGSIPVPRLFDIRRPSGAWITEWMFTSENGISPVNSSPIITIRATHKKMMSRAVESTSVGYQARISGVSSGQPSVANGQSAEENHVSSTSSSRRSSPSQVPQRSGASVAT